VVAAVAAHQEIESDLVPAIATAFCSGISESGGMCGALTGGILALSMAGGRRSNADSREALYAQTRILISGFQDQFEAINCPDLIHIQLGTPEASAAYKAGGLSRQCEEYIRAATEQAVILLQEAD